MRRFQFRLETVLKVRKRQEDQAQLKLIQAQDALRREQELLASIEAETIRNRLEWQRALSNNKTIADFIMYSTYLEQLVRQQKQQEQVIVEAEKQQLEALFAFQEALKKRKIVERLKEKKRQQYIHESLMQEQKILDEMGTLRYQRES